MLFYLGFLVGIYNHNVMDFINTIHITFLPIVTLVSSAVMSLFAILQSIINLKRLEDRKKEDEDLEEDIDEDIS